MTGTVEYDVQFLDHGAVKAAQSVISRYVIVLTPAEVQWRGSSSLPGRTWLMASFRPVRIFYWLLWATTNEYDLT